MLSLFAPSSNSKHGHSFQLSIRVNLWTARSPTHSGMADIKKRFHSVAFFSNLASSLCLSVLLALGVFVNVNKFIVGTDSTQGYKAINLDTVPWNVVCTVIGTAVGILAAVVFSNQDDVLTRC